MKSNAVQGSTSSPLLEDPSCGHMDAKESLWNRLVWKNGVLLVGLSAFLFAVVLVIVKSMQDEVPEMQMLWVRGLLISIAIPLAAKIFKSGISFAGKRENKLFLVALGFVGSAQLACLWISIKHIPIAETLSVYSINTIITASLAGIMGLDRWSKITPIAVVLSVTGVLLVTRPAVIFSNFALVWDADRIRGLSFAAGGTLLLVMLYLISRKLNNREGGTTLLFWQSLMSVGLATACLAMGVPSGPAFHLPLQYHVETLIPALLGALPWFLLYRSVHLTSATVGSVVGSTQLMWSFVFDMLVFGQKFSALSLVGCLCMLGASAIIAFTVVKVKPNDQANNMDQGEHMDQTEQQRVSEGVEE